MQRDDFRDDLPVSRGQWRALALCSLDRLGEAAPTTRMDATELLVRFQRGADAATDRPAEMAGAVNGGGAR